MRFRMCMAGMLIIMSASCRNPQETVLSPYPDFQADVIALRDTSKFPNSERNYSSAKACQAARRVFTRNRFEGMSRSKVRDLLGDPKTIRDGGITAGPEVDSPFIYRFDSGLGGWQYTLVFRNGVVLELKEEGLN